MEEPINNKNSKPQEQMQEQTRECTREQVCDQAVAAGERALRSLRRTKDDLKAAGKYGLWDMFGGGFLSGAMKHSKVDSAKAAMAKTRDSMAEFHGLMDVLGASLQQKEDIGEFIKFADYFVEKPMADWAVQSRLSDAGVQLSIAADRLEHLLSGVGEDI